MSTELGNAFSIILNPLPRVICKPNAAKDIGAEVIALGGKKVLLITDAGVTAAGITADIEAFLADANVACATYGTVEPNPTFANVRDGISMMLAMEGGLKDTVIVSLGGGSAMDCAKVVPHSIFIHYPLFTQIHPHTHTGNLCYRHQRRRFWADRRPAVLPQPSSRPEHRSARPGLRRSQGPAREAWSPNHLCANHLWHCVGNQRFGGAH